MSLVGRVCALLLLVAACTQDVASKPAHSNPAVAEHPEAETEDEAPELESRSFPLLIWSAWVVQTDYFDKTRFDPKTQLLTSVEFLGLQTPEFFAEPSADGSKVSITVRAATAEFGLHDVTDLVSAADRLESILEFTQSVLHLDEEPLHELEYAAINGLFAALDPHTILLTPEEHTDLGVRTKGEFGGIGAEIRADARRIRIIRTLPGRPAAKAGVEAGDLLLKIENESTVNMTASDAQQLLRGPAGAAVTVRIQRGKKLLTISIVRQVIKIDSVTHTLLPGGVGYLRVTSFQESTGAQMQKAIETMQAQELAGVVIDLRGNSGGLLTQATAMVDQLVSEGELVIVRSALGRESDPAAAETTVLGSDKAVVVLVDEHSASAAEIVSGGVRALGRGVVLGRSSFGKGTVQMLKPATPYGRELALKLTVAEYLVSGDRTIQSVGVVPDLELIPVELTNIRGIVRFFDAERFERARERARTANFPSAKHEHQRGQLETPALQLRYLATDAVEPSDLEGIAGQADAKLPEEMADPEIRIARRVAAALEGKSDRADRLARLKEMAQTLAGEEDTKVVGALGQDRIDWAARVSGDAQANLEVKAFLRKDEPVLAGEPFALGVEVANRGSEPVTRVHVISDCVHDELDGIELMIGTVAAGETVTRDLRLHVMPWHADFKDSIALDVHVGEPGPEPDGRATVMFEIRSNPWPSLVYDSWIIDDPELAKRGPKRPQGDAIQGEPPFEVQGNGDGLIQPGEKVLLAFVARNDGVGRSVDARALLRNLSGSQGLLEEGLVQLGQIAPGGEATGAFGITISPQADPALPFEVELIVGDGRLRKNVRHKMRFRVMKEAGAFKASPSHIRVDAEQLRLYNGGHSSADVVGVAPVGTTLEVAGMLGDWWVIESGVRGRRLFIPVDAPGLKVVPDASAHELAKVERRVTVQPPILELDELPLFTEKASVTIRGRATHPVRVRDAVVSVLPPGPAQIEKKVHYVANPIAQGKGAADMRFEAQIALEPGGNRITIAVRDGNDVEQIRRVRIYRQ